MGSYLISSVLSVSYVLSASMHKALTKDHLKRLFRVMDVARSASGRQFVVDPGWSTGKSNRTASRLRSDRDGLVRAVGG